MLQQQEEEETADSDNHSELSVELAVEAGGGACDETYNSSNKGGGGTMMSIADEIVTAERELQDEANDVSKSNDSEEIKKTGTDNVSSASSSGSKMDIDNSSAAVEVTVLSEDVIPGGGSAAQVKFTEEQHASEVGEEDAEVTTIMSGSCVANAGKQSSTVDEVPGVARTEVYSISHSKSDGDTSPR